MSNTSLEILLLDIQTIETDYPVVKASQYLTLAGFTVLIYDYFLTFGLEVDVIWKSRRSVISMIYLVNRYLVPLVLIVDLYDRLGLAANPSVLFCKIWTTLEAYLMFTSLMSLHMLVAMRVHALHGGRKPLKILLWICGILYAVTTCGILTVTTIPRIDTLAPAPFFNQCLENISPYLWTVWIPSLVFEALLFVLTISKAFYEARRHVYSPIASILYRDGILYFIVISACTVFSMLIWLLGSRVYIGLAIYFTLSISNVTASRLVLHLKHEARNLLDAHSQTPVISSFGHHPLDFDRGATEYINLDEYKSYDIGTVYPSTIEPYFEAI